MTHPVYIILFAYIILNKNLSWIIIFSGLYNYYYTVHSTFSILYACYGYVEKFTPILFTFTNIIYYVHSEETPLYTKRYDETSPYKIRLTKNTKHIENTKQLRVELCVNWHNKTCLFIHYLQLFSRFATDHFAFEKVLTLSLLSALFIYENPKLKKTNQRWEPLKSSFWTQVADKSYAVIARCICSYLHACRAYSGPVFTRFLSYHIFLVEKINYCILCLIVNLSVLINCRKS